MLGPALLLALAPSARALELTVAIDPAAARQVGIDPAEAEATIRATTSDALDMQDPEAFLGQMASANAVATSGMGVDYASNPQRFFAGASLGTATSGGPFALPGAEDPLSGPGFAFQASATVGVNLGLVADDASPLRRFVVSANGVVARDQIGAFTAEMENLGAHVQWKALPPVDRGLWRWGGLDLTTGYEVSRYRLLLADAVPIDAGDVQWNAAGAVDLSAESRTIPVEFSTNARFAFLTGYVGAAVDVRPVAGAEGEVALSGPLIAESRGQEVPIGTVDARLGASGAAAEVAPRFFGGIQLNVHVVKIYGHVNVASDDTVGGHVGARVAL